MNEYIEALEKALKQANSDCEKLAENCPEQKQLETAMRIRNRMLEVEKAKSSSNG